MARTASGEITQGGPQGLISDEAFNQLVSALITPPPGPATNSIPGGAIGRSSSGKIKQQPITQEHLDQADEATKQTMLAILADKMGIDIRASLLGGTPGNSIPGSGVSGRSAAGTITQQAAPARPDIPPVDQQLQDLMPQSDQAVPTPTPVESPSTPATSATSSTVQAKKLKPGELDKSPTILAKYSAPNDIIATVDSNGQLNLSNTAQNTGAKIIQINKEQADIQKQMDAITKEEDLNTREALLGKFHADQVEQQTEALTTFRAKAEQQLGITQLRGQLAASIARDQASPNYRLFNGIDSPGTEHIRRLVQQSESQVEKVTQEMAMADPTFRRRNTEITDFIGMQQKQIMQMMNKQASGDQRTEQKQQDRAAKVEAAASVLTPIGMEIVQSRNPELATNPESIKDLAYNLMTTPATKLEAQMLLAMPDNLSVYQAAAMGATMADPYIAKKQQELTGDLPEQTLSDLKQVRTMVTPAGEAMLSDAMQKYGTPKMREEWKMQKASRMLASKTTEGRHQQQLQLMGNAIYLKSAEKAARFYNQVNSWKPVNGVSLYDLPDVKELLEKNKSVSMQEMFQAYVGSAPKELKAARFEELKKIAVGNVKSLNAGMYGQVTREDMLEAKMTSYLLADRFNTRSESEAGLAGRADLTNPIDIFGSLQ